MTRSPETTRSPLLAEAEVLRTLLPIRLSGLFRAGLPIERDVDREVLVPLGLWDIHEEILQIDAVATPGFRRGDLLVVEPRPLANAATGECVLVVQGSNAYIGRWWSMRGRRALLDEAFGVVLEDESMSVIGAVTVIMSPHSEKRGAASVTGVRRRKPTS